MSVTCLLRSVIWALSLTIPTGGEHGSFSSFTWAVNVANSSPNFFREAKLLSTFLVLWHDLCLVSLHEDESSSCESLSANVFCV